MLTALLGAITIACNPPAPERCQAVGQATLDTIERELIASGAFLSRAGAVKSEVLDQVWFVAAEIDGGSYGGQGEVGVWATNTDPTSSTSALFLSMNHQARVASGWGDGTSSGGGLISDDDGPAEATACLGATAEDS
jgi:hypothetical protein